VYAAPGRLYVPLWLLPAKYESTLWYPVPVDGAGGSTARPTLSTVGSMVERNALIPSFACAILESASIDSVRSSTIMTSSGSPPQGEHAWAWALSWIVSKPSSLSRYVGTLAVSSTVTVFGCPRVQLYPAWA
jgi:hypothetical protein